MSPANSKPEQEIPDEHADFYCCAERHLAHAQYGKTAAVALLYSWSLQLSKESRRFTPTPREAARHLRLPLRSVQRAYERLKDSGWWKLIRSGKASGERSIYQPLTHKEWAAAHPGQCVRKIEFAWTPEGDALGKRLYAITGCLIHFKAFQVEKWYRKLGFSDEEIISLFELWFPRHQAEQEATSKRRVWRRHVGYHFGEYLRSLKATLEKAKPSEHATVLENAKRGLPFLSHDVHPVVAVA